MGLKKLIRNVCFLTKNTLKNEERLDFEGLLEEAYLERRDNCKYKFPNICDEFETIKEIKRGKSICRFGDGELELIMGNNIPFQKSSSELSTRLKEVLSSNNGDILIALPKFIYSSKLDVTEITRKFWLSHGKRFRDTIAPHLNDGQTYYAADFTLASLAYLNFDVETYFREIQSIFKDRSVSIVCGENVFKDIVYNIFCSAKSVKYIYGLSIDAFSEYKNLLEKCSEIPKSDLVIIILGPTAKILAYDLALKGYQALDLGHVAKAYDWYMKNKLPQNMQQEAEFFQPD